MNKTRENKPEKVQQKPLSKKSPKAKSKRKLHRKPKLEQDDLWEIVRW